MEGVKALAEVQGRVQRDVEGHEEQEIMTYAVYLQHGRPVIDHETPHMVGCWIRGGFTSRERAREWFLEHRRIAGGKVLFPGDVGYNIARIPEWIDEEETYAESERD